MQYDTNLRMKNAFKSEKVNLISYEITHLPLKNRRTRIYSVQ